MTDNLADEALDDPTIPQPENLLDEPPSTDDTNTIITNQQLKSMEVHHHPQVEKKSYKEYLLEGLMIFLAVTMGFIAENIRENIAHHEKEKQQIESFVNALQSDSAQLEFDIKVNDTILKCLLNFTELRKQTKVDEQFVKDFYNNSYVGLTLNAYFKSNDAALQEMKSSGIIGALKHRNIADSIFKYQQNNNLLQAQEEDDHYLFKESFSYVRDNVDFNNYIDTTNTKITLAGGTIFFAEFKDYKKMKVPQDKDVLKKLYSHAASLLGAGFPYINILKEQLAYNKRLSSLLKKEYHLE